MGMMKNQTKNANKHTVPAFSLQVAHGKQWQWEIVSFVDWRREGHDVDRYKLNWKNIKIKAALSGNRLNPKYSVNTLNFV